MDRECFFVWNHRNDGTTTTYHYDRNRLLSATANGFTFKYNYEPFGRLDHVDGPDGFLEKYTYDGFDRIQKYTKQDPMKSTTKTYQYDPLDRTVSQTDGTTKVIQGAG